MTTAQVGIFEPPGTAQAHVELRLRAGVDTTALRGALRAVRRSSAVKPFPVVGFSSRLWLDLAGKPAPVSDFEPLAGRNGWRAPSTQADLWLWAHSDRTDQVHDAIRAVLRELTRYMDVVVDVQAFVRHENRDLIGFVDGTANPKDEARILAACIDSNEPGAGGSIVLTQKWVHDLDRFHAFCSLLRSRVRKSASEFNCAVCLA
jgi:porphyrinogen peroxidase